MPGYKRNRGGDAWQLIVTIGSDATGRPRRYTKTVHCSEAEAEKELARFFSACDSGSCNASNPQTVSDLAELYYEDYCKRNHKTSTLRSDNSAIKTWIVPLLGKKKIAKLKKVDIQKWINYMSDSGVSGKTVRNYFGVLRKMMAYAIDMDLLQRNPCDNVRMPRQNRKESHFYTNEEVKRILSALDGENPRYKCAVILAMFGGFRKGEILGFDVQDVNFESHTLTVRQTRMIAPASGVYVDTPKTEQSRRTVALPAFVFEELSKLDAEYNIDSKKAGKFYVNSPALIRSESGKPLYPQVLQRWFTRFCEKNNLPAYGMHALRHTHASMLANIGADKMLVSKRLGHSQLSTTLDIYTHLFENTDTTVANLLDAYVDNAVDNKK